LGYILLQTLWVYPLWSSLPPKLPKWNNAKWTYILFCTISEIWRITG